MKIVVCGSMAFAEKMADAKEKLEKNGHIVFAPPNLNDFLGGATPESEKSELKVQLDIFKEYFNEIKESDAVLVLNYEKKGIPGYIGANALIEMAFAHVQDIPIYLMHPIPKQEYTDEIVAMNPIVLNEDLSAL